ncbi:hypothetical protein BSP38_180 [Bacillus phage BSP38]|uniref:Uncharacterized protein n=1 Tax=Bacillus phage BSP38 TaxID=2283013 RepID=A0A345MK40_BPBSP|nr:hypothetical protein HWB82_gp138 [Bacillus phage BSP38]AXH71222.1 hypothetical protein BSP38_180 [Bacillus phage BSP38]
MKFSAAVAYLEEGFVVESNEGTLYNNLGDIRKVYLDEIRGSWKLIGQWKKLKSYEEAVVALTHKYTVCSTYNIEEDLCVYESVYGLIHLASYETEEDTEWWVLVQEGDCEPYREGWLASGDQGGAKND